MIIKLSKIQKDLLINKGLSDRLDLKNKILEGKEYNNNWIIYVSEDFIDELRDACSDKLIEIGFDDNYKLNGDGIVLESLVDLLYFG